jgi:hypothetical protein
LNTTRTCFCWVQRAQVQATALALRLYCAYFPSCSCSQWVSDIQGVHVDINYSIGRNLSTSTACLNKCLNKCYAYTSETTTLPSSSNAAAIKLHPHACPTTDVLMMLSTPNAPKVGPTTAFAPSLSYVAGHGRCCSSVNESQAAARPAGSRS